MGTQADFNPFAATKIHAKVFLLLEIMKFVPVGLFAANSK